MHHVLRVTRAETVHARVLVLVLHFVCADPLHRLLHHFVCLLWGKSFIFLIGFWRRISRDVFLSTASFSLTVLCHLSQDHSCSLKEGAIFWPILLMTIYPIVIVPIMIFLLIKDIIVVSSPFFTIDQVFYWILIIFSQLILLKLLTIWALCSNYLSLSRAGQERWNYGMASWLLWNTFAKVPFCTDTDVISPDV